MSLPTMSQIKSMKHGSSTNKYTDTSNSNNLSVIHATPNQTGRYNPQNAYSTGNGIQITGSLDMEYYSTPSAHASKVNTLLPTGMDRPLVYENIAYAPCETKGVMPIREVFTPSSTSVQQQVNSESANVNMLPADLQVQLELTGYSGTQNRARSDIIIPEDRQECPHIDDFGMIIKGARSPFEGPPSMTRAKKYMFDGFDMDVTKPRQPKYPYKIKKPDIRDFVPPQPVGIMVGEDDAKQEAITNAGGACSGATCSCRPPKDMIWSSVQAMMISGYNYLDLQKTLIDRGLIIGVKNYIIWSPRKDLCLCSYIGRFYAAMYVDFSNRMRITPASKEINLKTTIREQNNAFATDLLGKIFSAQQQTQIWNYAKAAGRLRGLNVRPAFEPDAPAVTRPIHCMGASDIPQVFGPDFANNPDTYSAAWSLSKPASIFHEDFKKWTGIDYSQHHRYKNNIPMR